MYIRYCLFSLRLFIGWQVVHVYVYIHTNCVGGGGGSGGGN